MEKTLHPLVVFFTGFLACCGVVARGEPPAAELAKLHTQEAQAYRIFADEQRLRETRDKTYTCYRARTIDELPDSQQ